MIQVPELVKDALRDGRMKKNYRFIVETQETPAHYEEIAQLSEREKYTITEDAGYMVIGTGVDSWTGITTWDGDEELEWLNPDETEPNTTWSGGLDPGDTISVSGFNGITYVSVMKWVEATPASTITIDNNNLVKESVKIDERMCSGDTLKFGLCEGSSLEFQYFGYPSIKGNRIQAFIDVDYGEELPYAIPMGYFTVEKCSRQASTGIIKVTAYNKLMSDYLDANATEAVADIVAQGEFGYTDSISTYSLLKNLLSGYGIQEESYSYTELASGGTRSYNLESYPLCSASGVPTGTNLYLYMLTISLYLDEEEFYKFYLYTEEMFDNARQHVWWTYKDYYTLMGSEAWYIDQVAESAYANSRPLCGDISLRKRVNVNTFFFTEKGGATNRETDTYSKCYSIDVTVPVHAVIASSPPSIVHSTWDYYFNDRWGDWTFYKAYKENLSEILKLRLTTNEIESIQNVTLRELQSAVFETDCQFGQLDRETDLFSGVELNSGGLYPSNTLYPSDSLYPSGAGVTSNKSYYSKLWTDEHGAESFRNLVITYKGLDANNQEADFEFTKVVNANGTTDYIMDSNWLFRNLVWTQADISDYADAMAAKMAGIRWFPFEMWCAGLPYVETGDLIEIAVGENTYPSYILQRTLQGIQNLQDTYINGVVDVF